MNLSEQSDKSIAYHSVVFVSGNTEINTWDDWHLIPSSPPSISPPAVRTKYEEDPGKNSQIDLTEILDGSVHYEDHEGSWSFFIANGYNNRAALFHKISDFLYGKKMDVILLDDPNYIYTGRFSVGGFKSGKNNSTIDIKYELVPRC